MRIVVTGAAGRIGRTVVAELVTHGHEVLAVDRVAPPVDGPAGGVAWTQADVRDLDAMTSLLRPGAGRRRSSTWPPSRRRRLGGPLEVFATNTQATFAVLEAAGMAGVPRVAIASSTSVTGLPFASPPVSPLYVPVDEAHPNVGSDPYALPRRPTRPRPGRCTGGMGTRSSPSGSRTPRRWRTSMAGAADVARDPSGLACELWAYLDVRDGARAFRLAVEREVPGCHVINVMAPDTYSAEPTAELLARYHPRPSSAGRSWAGRCRSTSTRSRDLLGFRRGAPAGALTFARRASAVTRR